jgi:hypothetical protein
MDFISLYAIVVASFGSKDLSLVIALMTAGGMGSAYNQERTITRANSYIFD